MISLGTVLMLIAFANMIIPPGSIKKYVSLAMGFMIITAALSVLPSKWEDVSFSPESFELDADDVAASQAQYRAQVLRLHRENLEKKIKEQMHHGSKAHVEVSAEGEVISVTLILRGDESKAVSYIVEKLGVPRERIKLKYDKN